MRHDTMFAGENAGQGDLQCAKCGETNYHIAGEQLNQCAVCGNSRFYLLDAF